MCLGLETRTLHSPTYSTWSPGIVPVLYLDCTWSPVRVQGEQFGRGPQPKFAWSTPGLHKEYLAESREYTWNATWTQHGMPGVSSEIYLLVWPAIVCQSQCMIAHLWGVFTLPHIFLMDSWGMGICGIIRVHGTVDVTCFCSLHNLFKYICSI